MKKQLLRLGLPTWESHKLRGTLYDYHSPIQDFLKIYSAQFDAVELHQSFHEIARADWEKMTDEVRENKNFRFYPMIPRRISHESTLGENYFELKEFLDGLSSFGSHLGTSILRLPETFAPSSWKMLLRFLTKLPTDKRFAVHLTHMDWSKGEHIHYLVRALQGSPISILIEDNYTLSLPVERLLSTDQLIVRFFARPGLAHDEQRLAMWVHKLAQYQDFGVKEAAFFLYEQEEMCLGILRKMADSLGQVRIPQKFDANAEQISFLL